MSEGRVGQGGGDSEVEVGSPNFQCSKLVRLSIIEVGIVMRTSLLLFVRILGRIVVGWRREGTVFPIRRRKAVEVTMRVVESDLVRPGCNAVGVEGKFSIFANLAWDSFNVIYRWRGSVVSDTAKLP